MQTKKSTNDSAPVKDRALKTGKKEKGEATIDVSRFQDEVRAQAYYNFLKRLKNNVPGNEDGDWFEAEEIVRMKMSTH